MYAVIAGGGKVGRFIATDLLDEGHDVAIIERVPDRCVPLLREHDPLVIHGDATDVRSLERARVERADVLVATTRDDKDNFVTCQLAIGSLGVPRAISRVNLPRNEKLFKRLGIEAVSTTSLISRLLREELHVDELIHLTTLRGGKVNLVEIDIPEDAPAPTCTLAELDVPQAAVIACVFRGEATIIPHADLALEAGDRVIALTEPAAEAALRRAVLTDRCR